MATRKIATMVMLVLLFSYIIAKVSSSDQAESYIVFTEEFLGTDPQDHFIEVLTVVLCSEDAAKEALMYTYSFSEEETIGFAAALTTEQVVLLLEQPGIISAIPDRAYQLEFGQDLN